MTGPSSLKARKEMHFYRLQRSHTLYFVYLFPRETLFACFICFMKSLISLYISLFLYLLPQGLYLTTFYLLHESLYFTILLVTFSFASWKPYLPALVYASFASSKPLFACISRPICSWKPLFACISRPICSWKPIFACISRPVCSRKPLFACISCFLKDPVCLY